MFIERESRLSMEDVVHPRREDAVHQAREVTVCQEGRDHSSGGKSSVRKSGSVWFFAPKWATIDRNQSRTDPDIAGTERDHLGPVFCSPWN